MVAGLVVRARRGQVMPPEADGADEDSAATRVLDGPVRWRAPLPAVGAVGCTPRAGWACWRGRLRLSPEVRRGWKARRAQARAARHADEEADEDTTGAGTAASAGASSNAGDLLAAAPDDEVDPVAELADVPLPPDSGFRAFFDIRLFRTGGRDQSLDDGTSGQDEPSAELNDDGSFEVQVPPGRYGLEAQSQDDLVTGGRDDLPAVAGAALEGVDIELGPTVMLTGRVLDGDGVMVPATVTAARVGDDESRSTVGGPGTFHFDGLRAGTFRLTAEAEGQTVSAMFAAPQEGAVLRLPRTGAGLLILPPGPDGRCGRATVVAVAHAPDDRSATRGAPSYAGGHGQRWHTTDCQVVLETVAPGSEWDVFMLRTGAAPIKGRVQFGFESPAAPVCLVAGCSTAVAALQIRAIDIDGRMVERAATVTATAPTGEAEVSTVEGEALGFRVGESVTVEVRLGAMAISRQVWLQAGVNRAVIPFPVRVEGAQEEERQIVMLR